MALAQSVALADTARMSKLRVHAFSISLDGYGAGPNQGLEHPLGAGGEQLHEWVVATRTFQQIYRAGWRHHRRG